MSVTHFGIRIGETVCYIRCDHFVNYATREPARQPGLVAALSADLVVNDDGKVLKCRGLSTEKATEILAKRPGDIKYLLTYRPAFQ